MSPNLVLLLQSSLIFLQMVNAGVGSSVHMSPVWSMILAAFVGAFQFYVNHLGNGLPPSQPPQQSGKIESSGSNPPTSPAK